MPRITGDGGIGNSGYAIHDFSGDVKAERLQVSLDANIEGNVVLSEGSIISGDFIDTLQGWSKVRCTGQSIPNASFTGCNWNIYTAGENWIYSTNRVLPPRPGIYRSDSYVSWSLGGFATGDVISLRILHYQDFSATASVVASTRVQGGTTAPELTVPGLPIYCDGEESTFAVQVYQARGSATFPLVDFAVHAISN